MEGRGKKLADIIYGRPQIGKGRNEIRKEGKLWYCNQRSEIPECNRVRLRLSICPLARSCGRTCIPFPSQRHGCQMAIAGFLARMSLALLASGLWLCYTTLQNWIPSFPRIAPGWRKGREPILPSGNPAVEPSSSISRPHHKWLETLIKQCQVARKFAHLFHATLLHFFAAYNND